MRFHRTRRGFLEDVGRGTLVATLGSGLAADLGLSTAFAEDRGDRDGSRLRFGALDPLVDLMQETPADQLLAAVVDRLRGGTPLRDLVASAAFANARTFGGEDYVGFHTMMALAPAYHMAGELPEGRRALPVLKVLHRNSSRIQESGGRDRDTLRPVEPLGCLPDGLSGGEALREAVRAKDMELAKRTFAALAQGGGRPSLQRAAPCGPGQHRGPPHRPSLPSLGPAGHHRPRTGAHAAPPVGALLRCQ